MDRTSKAVLVGAATAAAGGLAVVRRLSDRLPGLQPGLGGHGDPDRWRAVTVNRPLEEVEGLGLEPLAALGGAVEVRLVPAPGDKGTEVHARLTGRERSRLGDRPLETLRSALREAKQVAEVGEVLRADGPVTTERTLLNRPLEAVLRRAGGEGRL